jgi:hypothetical protein
MLCLLLSSVKDAEKILELSPVEQSEASVFVAVLVSLINGDRSGDLLEKMDTFNSPEMVSTCLNIAKLWNNILGEILNEANKFTIKMGTEVTTALKTLNSLILPIIPECIILGASQVDGLQSSAINAERPLIEKNANTKNTLMRIAAELASWKTDENGTTANTAAKSLQPLTPSVNSVLLSVQQDIITHCGQTKSPLTVQDAENSLRQSPQDHQSIAENNATSKIDKPLSPAHEPIVLAMKPIESTFAANAEKWGVSGLNIDGGRVGTEDDLQRLDSNPLESQHRINHQMGYRKSQYYKGDEKPKMWGTPKGKGRFPANVIWDGSEEVKAEFDKAGVSVSSDRIRNNNNNNKGYTCYGNYNDTITKGFSDSGTPARFFAQCPPDPTAHPKAARFHYCPKAGKRERGNGNNHPTVKPLSLLRYLARLTRPPDGGIVLDPFGGSGTTALACIAEGRDFILIEKEPEYAELCRRRIAEYSGAEVAPVEHKVTEAETVEQMSLW